MKHLKIKGELLPGMEQVKVTILEQTHFRDGFGLPYGGLGYDGSRTFHGGRVRLGSFTDRGMGRTWNTDHQRLGLRYTFYVKNTPLEDKPPTIVTLEQWEELKVAVEAYNEHFK